MAETPVPLTCISGLFWESPPAKSPAEGDTSSPIPIVPSDYMLTLAIDVVELSGVVLTVILPGASPFPFVPST